MPPQTWLILAGRGFGKTRTDAETVRQMTESKQAHYIELIGQSMVEAVSVMVQGEGGLWKSADNRSGGAAIQA